MNQKIKDVLNNGKVRRYAKEVIAVVAYSAAVVVATLVVSTAISLVEAKLDSENSNESESE